ncbi:putative beta-amylase [Helianthus anomalus]
MNNEYISLGCGTILCIKGRTPIHCYSDYMCAFRDKFSHFLGDTIVYMLGSLKAAAENYGKPEWGNIGPTDAGEYNN